VSFASVSFTGGANLFDVTNGTGLTPTFQNATLNITGSAVSQLLNLGNTQSYGPIIINNNSTKGAIKFVAFSAVTMASLTVGSGSTVIFTESITTTISGALTVTGTSSAPSGIQSNAPQAAVATVSVGSASTISWGAILRITRTGAGSITATNSFDLGGNNTGGSFSITGPSGGGGGRIIGG
jgi:hypothetical protein